MNKPSIWLDKIQVSHFEIAATKSHMLEFWMSPQSRFSVKLIASLYAIKRYTFESLNLSPEHQCAHRLKNKNNTINKLGFILKTLGNVWLSVQLPTTNRPRKVDSVNGSGVIAYGVRGGNRNSSWSKKKLNIITLTPPTMHGDLAQKDFFLVKPIRFWTKLKPPILSSNPSSSPPLSTPAMCLAASCGILIVCEFKARCYPPGVRLATNLLTIETFTTIVCGFPSYTI